MALNEEKRALRRHVKDVLRRNRAEKSRKSTAIWQRLEEIPAFRAAIAKGKLMTYLDFDDEVETTRFLGPKIVIPYCDGDNIVPFGISSLDELEKGRFGILEPRNKDRRKTVDPADISVVLVPGLAFDVHGNRLGRGKGFYDRFLATLRADTVTIGLAFECQVFEKIPVDSEDRPVSRVVTEERIFFSGAESSTMTESKTPPINPSTNYPP